MNTASERNAAIYVRTDPDPTTGPTIKEQIEACWAYAKNEGYPDPWGLIDEGKPGLEPDGLGGAKTNFGDGLRSLGGALLQGRLSMVIVTDRTRISHDPDLFGHFHLQCRFSKVRFISLKDEASGEKYLNPHIMDFVRALASDHASGRLTGPLKDLGESMLAKGLELKAQASKKSRKTPPKPRR